MTVWDQIAWAPICIALTAAGLVISWFAWRRKGPQRALRAAAWSLLPLAAYLTGAIRMIGQIGSAVVQFAGSFVFSPRSWAGVVLFGAAALLFLGTGGLPLLRWKKSRGKSTKAVTATPTAAGRTLVPAAAGKGKRAATADTDDDLGEVEEILRRRGIS